MVRRQGSRRPAYCAASPTADCDSLARFPAASLTFITAAAPYPPADGRPLRDLRALPPPLPWESLLTAGEVQRGISYYGGGARLRQVAQKLLDRKPIKVFTLGGSVTYGHGVEDAAQSYPSLFFRFINETFPHRSVGLQASVYAITLVCAITTAAATAAAPAAAATDAVRLVMCAYWLRGHLPVQVCICSVQLGQHAVT